MRGLDCFTPIVLTVAGSDSVAGAGLQADVKTVAALGGHALSAVTAVTVQDSARVYHVHPLPADLVARQMRAGLADMPVGCIKLGMLATAEIVAAVAAVLDDWPDIPVVADPVLAGSGGGTLLESGGIIVYQQRLLPLVTLITPNLPEAAAFTGQAVENHADMERAARALCRAGCAVLVTGGHLPGATVTDLLLHAGGRRTWSDRRLHSPGGFHGTGCALASAIATGLAGGYDLEAAVTAGRAFVRRAMEQSLPLGKGQNILNTFSSIHAPLAKADGRPENPS